MTPESFSEKRNTKQNPGENVEKEIGSERPLNKDYGRAEDQVEKTGHHKDCASCNGTCNSKKYFREKGFDADLTSL